MSRCPKKFAASTPVSNRITKKKTRPRPGMSKPNNARGRAFSGNTSRIWSTEVSRKCRTQIVMPSGIQTISPAIR